MSFISSSEIINVVKPDPKIFWWIVASIVNAAAVNPNGIKTVLAYGLSTFLINAIQFLIMVLKFSLKILLIQFYWTKFLEILY